MLPLALAIEIIGLSLLGIELGILIGRSEKKGHWVGYTGAMCLVLGGILWAKVPLI